MAAEAPNSYRDPYWADLASSVESKLELPKGLLVAVLTRGERSNADQVSEAGAKTPFQIIPKTREAAIEKWGVDPYLSPENAAEVAGRLLKDSLQRNRGDAALAVAEYHGGTDRSNWGPRTQAYVRRVVGATPQAVPDQPATVTTSLPPSGGEPSTFQKALAAQQGAAAASPSIANVYAAYQAGQMTPEEAQQFEQDVRDGKLMLPRGAALKASAGGAPTPDSGDAQPAGVVPAGVIDAYVSGRMPEEDRRQFEQDVAAGVARLPSGTPVDAKGMPRAPAGVEKLPGYVAPPPPKPDPSLGEKLVGTGEAALTAATGATGGTVGMFGGFLKGLAEEILSGKFGTPEANGMVERAMQQGASALTYQPRTESGKDQAEALGQAMQQLVPIAGVAHTMPPVVTAAAGTPKAVVAQAAAESTGRSVAGDAGAAAAGKTVTAAARAADLAKTGVTTLPRRALEALRRDPESTPTPGTMGSAGAAGTDMAAQRRATAADLPVPINLTKGQATRDPAQLKFEVETAKMPEAGAPLRQRFVQQNDAILRNFDTWIDQTGAEAPNLRAVGVAVDKALVEQAARDKTAIRVAYKAAEKAGEMEAPVTLEGVVQHLNESAPDAAVSPLLDAARRRALQLGIATEQGGQLVAQPVPLKTAEIFRRAVGNATDYQPTNVRQSTIIKALVDEATDGMGGDLYRQARALRARYAQNYENRATVAKLLARKKGTTDRQVAFEDVFQHSVLNGSLDDVRNVRRVLQRSGPNGEQAWRELQGATVQWIRDEATKSVATDSAGNRVISPAALDKAVRTLDHDGRLEFVFGKKGAQQLRDINELAQIAKTVPPEAGVNTSNTAATLLAAFGDVLVSGSTGTPVPLATVSRLALQHIRDVKLRRRITDALDEARTKQAPGNPRPPVRTPDNETIH